MDFVVNQCAVFDDSPLGFEDIKDLDDDLRDIFKLFAEDNGVGVGQAGQPAPEHDISKLVDNTGLQPASEPNVTMTEDNTGVSVGLLPAREHTPAPEDNTVVSVEPAVGPSPVQPAIPGLAAAQLAALDSQPQPLECPESACPPSYYVLMCVPDLLSTATPAPLSKATAAQPATGAKRRGVKTNDSRKRKMYELEPQEDELAEKKRRNAVAAKFHRDKKNQLIACQAKELEQIKAERDNLQQLVQQYNEALVHEARKLEQVTADRDILQQLVEQHAAERTKQTKQLQELTAERDILQQLVQQYKEVGDNRNKLVQEITAEKDHLQQQLQQLQNEAQLRKMLASVDLECQGSVML